MLPRWYSVPVCPWIPEASVAPWRSGSWHIDFLFVLLSWSISIHCRLETEEQRECLGCCYKEDTCANDHHDLLLENLLPNCKVLNINTPKKQKVPKETNWKQKFQKPQNENICLTYLNTEMNGNFHFLSFCAAFLKVQNQVLWTLLSFQQSGWKNGFSWKNVHEKWAFQVAFYSIFCENTVVCLTFYV